MFSHKIVINKLDAMAHAGNVSTWKAVRRITMSSRPAWNTEQDPVSNKQNKLQTLLYIQYYNITKQLKLNL